MMKTFKHPILILALMSLGIFISCDGGDSEPDLNIDQSLLVSKEKVHTWLKGDVKGFLSSSGLDVPLDKILYDVDIYDVEYLTLYKGEMITASGRVFLPVTNERVSTLCFSHGTIAADDEAMTNLKVGAGTTILLSGLASMGIVTIAPDLIGFGSSSSFYQPYFVLEPTATATIDNIYASKLLANELGVSTNADLYLAGYSQGGYSTMATHKYIEEKGIEYFDLKASFPASGGYHIKGVQDYFLGRETYHQPYYLALVAQGYFDFYDWVGQHSLDLFFNEPFATEIPDLVDGTYSGGEINAMLNDTVAVYIKADYIINSGSDTYKFLIDAYDENSPIGWIPKNSVFMYHGDADTTVPYQNSVEVFNSFMTAGASSDIVSFTSIPGGSHATGVGPYIEDFIAKVIAMENK